MIDANNIQAAIATKQKSPAASNALQHLTTQGSPLSFSQALQNELQAKSTSTVESKVKNEAFEFYSVFTRLSVCLSVWSA